MSMSDEMISTEGELPNNWASSIPLPKEPKKGVYVLEVGDTPGRVSIKLYGRSHRAVELVRLNVDSGWEPGDVIDLP